MKLKKMFGSSDQGFALMALMISLAIISITTIYVINQNKVLNLNTKSSEMDRARALTELTNMSSLSRVRGLLTAAKIGDSYESAVYPENYFAKDWTLVKNVSSAKPMNQVDVKGQQIWLPSSAAGPLTIAKAADIFAGNASQTELLTTMQNVEILKTHSNLDHLKYIDAIDVKTSRQLDLREGSKAAAVQTSGRIALVAPIPLGLKVRVKFPGDSEFTDEWNNSGRTYPVGDYTFQLLGSGVVNYVELKVGGITYLRGVDASGEVTHQANNIKAVDKVIGTVTIPLAIEHAASGDEKVEIDQCRFEVSGGGVGGDDLDSGVPIEARVFGVDEKENEALTTSGTIKLEGGKGDSAPEEPAGYGCLDRCPIVYKTQFWPNPTTQSKYLDLTVQGETDTKKLDYFEPDLSDEITARTKGIICGNMELVGQAMKEETGRIPSMLLSMGRTNYEKVRNKYIDAGLKRFYAYTAPTCNRQLVGKRTGCGCFADDTKIQMADGMLMAIRDIREGDSIWNPKTARAQTVKRVIAGPEKIPMYKISSGTEILVVTRQHPFLLSTGLSTAADLKIGDRISSGPALDDWRTVTAIEVLAWDGLSPAPVVWNIELNGSEDLADHYVLAGGLMTGDLFIQESLAQRGSK